MDSSRRQTPESYVVHIAAGVRGLAGACGRRHEVTSKAVCEVVWLSADIVRISWEEARHWHDAHSASRSRT
jgi:hypothetical protein